MRMWMGCECDKDSEQYDVTRRFFSEGDQERVLPHII